MLSGGLFSWLSGDQALMALLANNWILGVPIVASTIFLRNRPRRIPIFARRLTVIRAIATGG
jgi:hypothetical protein